MQIDYTKCDPYWCVARNIINELKGKIQEKKRMQPERIWTPSVSKDTLPESALSYYKPKPQPLVIQEGVLN